MSAKAIASVKMETEAKFVISDEKIFAAFRETKRLGDFEIKPVGIKRVIDRYLDGPYQQIFRSGFACRLRQVNQKQRLSLKSLTSAGGEVHRRQEIEIEVEGDQLQDWPEGEAKTLVLRAVGEAPLQTLFILYQTRHQYHLLWQERPVIELSLDEVSQSEAGQADYFELEAELIDAGTEADLRRFIDTLRSKWPLTTQRQSKFERAFAAYLHQQEERGTIILSDEEKSTLEHIARVDDKLLVKRALIILMSEAGSNPTHIAQEVELTPRTVKKWQRAFAERRMAIFPDDVLATDGQPITAESEITKAPQAERDHKDKAKKAKRKKKKKSEVVYKRKAIGLKPTDTLAEAGRKVLGFHFARMLKYEPGARLGQDIEELHDMRVATRRMRAAFNVFGQSFSKKAIKPLQAGLKVTAQALGPVRDLDVFLKRLQDYRQTLPEHELAGLQPLLDVLQTQHTAARDKMLVYLDSKGYLKFKQNFLKFVKTKGLGAKPMPDKVPPVPHQLRHVVPSLIYTYYAEIRAYETILDTAPIETLHQLRISSKGLRYTLEYLHEVLGDEKNMLIQEVKAMQDHLGELNDAEVASNMLRTFLEDWEAHQLHLPLSERQSPTPIVTYLNANLEKRHQLLVTFPDVWANFNRPEIRQNLAKAISIL